MSVIALEGMKFYAYHGFYEEERILGGEYLVDVEVEIDDKAAAKEDDLYKTINYETIYAICDFEMRVPSDLIETVIARIQAKLKATFSNLMTIRVKVHKMNPPLGGRVEKASVSSMQNFKTSCGRCGKSMACYKDTSCWCNASKKIHPRTAEMLKSEYKSCLCKSCLEFYAG